MVLLHTPLQSLELVLHVLDLVLLVLPVLVLVENVLVGLDVVSILLQEPGGSLQDLDVLLDSPLGVSHLLHHQSDQLFLVDV